MDLHSYRRRLNSSETMENTKKFINDNFSNNPFFQTVLVEGNKVDAIVNETSQTDEKSILFRPDIKIYKGDIVDYDNHLWLAMDANTDDIYPSVRVKLCNQTITKDDLEIPIVAVGKKNDLDENGKYIITTTNEVIIHASYQMANHIQFHDRFIMSNKEYEVIGIDNVTEVYQGRGIIKLTLEITGDQPLTNTKPEKDTDITDYGSWSDW